MRQNDKGVTAFDTKNQLDGVDLHDFIQQQKNHTNVELAHEFGMSSENVRELKKRMQRN